MHSLHFLQGEVNTSCVLEYELVVCILGNPTVLSILPTTIVEYISLYAKHIDTAWHHHYHNYVKVLSREYEPYLRLCKLLVTLLILV